jgi:type II secretory pathway pseudopilin PulG
MAGSAMRHRADKLQNCKITKLQNRSRGYILISLMLFLALLAVAALAVLPDIAFQVKRDREEELIHRAVAYSRGIRRYYKKYGRYPNRIEDLENTNNVRFIRKRYKDPVNNNQDFTILRWGDPRLVGLTLRQVAGLKLPGQTSGQSALGVAVQAGSALGATPTQPPTTSAPGGDSGTSSGGTTNANPSGSSPSSSSSDASSSTPQVLGGGPMVGVVSASTAKTIREFCEKNHYKDWVFIYDPVSDRGGLLNSPWCQNLNNRGFGGIPAQPVGGQVLPNSGLQGGVPPAQNPPNPGSPPMH